VYHHTGFTKPFLFLGISSYCLVTPKKKKSQMLSQIFIEGVSG
jgi:hypothetical protein